MPARAYPIERLCIERNPEVVVEDFLRGEESYKYAFGPAPTDLVSVRVAR